MRILATCQHGWPEPMPFLYPMEEMVRRGHSVHAITGMPNYPMGEFYKGYENNRICEETHNGVRITHVPLIPRKHDVFHRVLNYYSFSFSAGREIMKLKDDYDVVFATQSSPVMMAEPAIKYARKRDKKLVLYCMDLWPACLTAGGISRDSLVYRYYGRVSRRIYHSADVLLVTSKRFKPFFVDEFGIPAQNIHYLPQYAPDVFSDLPFVPEKDTTDFVFAGNVGIAQNLTVVLDAAKLMEGQAHTDNGKQIRFHIVGDGQDLERLRNYAKENGISNVVFHGRKPIEEMPRYYAMADAMIVTMLPDPLISMTLPAKVQTYMAAGKPIIASAEGEIAGVVSESGCGFCAAPDDATAFVRAIESFLAEKDREKYGARARVYYDAHFSSERLMDKLEGILTENCPSFSEA